MTMKKETKEALYSLLDLMDMLGSIEFINMDINKANSIRKEVLDVIGEKKERREPGLERTEIATMNTCIKIKIWESEDKQLEEVGAQDW